MDKLYVEIISVPINTVEKQYNNNNNYFMYINNNNINFSFLLNVPDIRIISKTAILNI